MSFGSFVLRMGSCSDLRLQSQEFDEAMKGDKKVLSLSAIALLPLNIFLQIISRKYPPDDNTPSHPMEVQIIRVTSQTRRIT